MRADRKAAAEPHCGRSRPWRRGRRRGSQRPACSRSSEAIEEAAADDVAEDKAQYAKLTQERASVEKRIAIRIAKAKAEAARKACRRPSGRRGKRAAANAPGGQGEQRAKRPGESTAKAATSRNGSPRRQEEGDLVQQPNLQARYHAPVSAPITSPYGMRFHPVLRYWKLHDGTDFGAGCGTPIRAPYSGRVAERYYNAGYGNRLMIDHGFVAGST